MQHIYLIVVIGRKIVAGEMIFFKFFYLSPNTYTHMHKIQPFYEQYTLIYIIPYRNSILLPRISLWYRPRVTVVILVKHE